MDKYIGFDLDSKETVACVVQKGQKDKFTMLKNGRFRWFCYVCGVLACTGSINCV